MKKSLLSILAIAALLTGCTREQNVETSIPHGKRIVTIQADITQTKTTVTDAGLYSWSENETIGVVERDGDEVISFSIEDAEKGLFTGTLTADPVFAVSPAAFVSNAVELGGDIEYDITLDNIDNYVPGTTNAIMVAEYSGKDGDEYKFHFTHAAALVKVRVENVPVGTAKVKLTLDKNITGIWADLTSTNPVLGEDTELGEPSLTLTLKKAVTNPNTSADYYFPVPCNTYTSFQFELLNADGDRIKGMKKTGLNISLDAADLFLAPTITLEPVEIVKGAEWTYTFTEKKFSANGTQALTDTELVSMNWTLDGSYTSDGYWAYDSGKGQQFGSGAKPYSSLTLSANYGVNGIEDVVINTSGASSIDATVSVSVGATAFVIKGSDPAETSASLTATATDYTFTSPDGELYVGDIVISYVNSSSKAIYLKTISLNPDTRIDPELAYATTAYSVVTSSAFEAPELSTVDGFNGTVTYAIGDGDDPDVASVNEETGVVTIGAKAGEVTITASFAGNADYKPDSASYTITVGAAALSVNTTSPANASYEEDSTTTFTVTSNVPWTAVAASNDSYIKGIYVGETQIDTATPVVQAASADAVTVTVKFNANNGEERSATIAVQPTDQDRYSTLNKTVTVTQDEYVAPSGKVFTRISSIDDLTLGTDAEYLLIYVPANDDPLAFNGSLTSGYDASAGVKVKFDDSGNADYDTYKGYALTISSANTTNKYWIKTAGGMYIGRNANSNGLDVYTPTNANPTPTSNYDNGIAFSNTGVVSITGNGGRALLYYPNNSNYRYYAAGNVAYMYLYKYEDATTWDLKSIAVKTAPTTTYDSGENFDPTGLVITATYSDHDGVNSDKTVDVAYGNETASAFAFSPALDQQLITSNTSVTISYTDNGITKTVDQDITVIEWTLSSIVVKTAPTKVIYTAGEYFNPAGLVITATYTAAGQPDKTVDVTYGNETTTAFTFAPTTSTALTTDDTTVSITWGGKTTSQAITVNEAGGTKTYTLTVSSITYEGQNSYTNCAGDRVYTAVATDNSQMSVTLNFANVMNGTGSSYAGKLQLRKSKDGAGTIYNKTDLGTITNISYDGTNNIASTNIGSSQQPSSAGSGGYFKIVNGASVSYVSITITFQK